MEEEQSEEEEEVHGLEDKVSAPFLTRAAYEKAISRGTTRKFVVPAEQQAYQQEQPAAGPIIIQEFEPKASPSFHDYTDLQSDQPAIIPSPVINKGEESSLSSSVSLSAQKTSPQSCLLNTKADHNSMPKADTDHLSLDILKPTQLASTKFERAACQMTEEEGV